MSGSAAIQALCDAKATRNVCEQNLLAMLACAAITDIEAAAVRQDADAELARAQHSFDLFTSSRRPGDGSARSIGAPGGIGHAASAARETSGAAAPPAGGGAAAGAARPQLTQKKLFSDEQLAVRAHAAQHKTACMLGKSKSVQTSADRTQASVALSLWLTGPKMNDHVKPPAVPLHDHLHVAASQRSVVPYVLDFIPLDSHALGFIPLDSHYATLGVPPTASTEDIREAFKALALAHHPDRGGRRVHRVGGAGRSHSCAYTGA
ncbi:hypothetical protein T484DRAFT_1895531 [Baffinella frigidus]|nr:hypothetical protein T484DRAFT_1895531 [Cryptophyta sp. CCMP2293]